MTEAGRTVPLHAPQPRVLAGGVDLVEVDRIHRAGTTWGDMLLHRLCNEQEQSTLATLEGSARRVGLAILFGLKEAVVKAAGGFPVGGRFTDIDGSQLLAASPCDESGAVTGPVVVRGRTATRLPGPPSSEQVCRGGAMPLDDETHLCWVLIEEEF